jgi:hypothetical protein
MTSALTLSAFASNLPHTVDEASTIQKQPWLFADSPLIRAYFIEVY